jgi:hypothetical protein
MKWLEPVKGARIAARAECLDCHRESMKMPSDVQAGKGCRHCAQTAPVSKTEQTRRAKAARITFLQPPTKSATPTPARCDVCGCEWKMRPNDIQQGKGCPDCGRQDDDLLPAAPKGEEGYTETIHTEDVPLAEIIRRIDTMIEDLRSASPPLMHPLEPLRSSEWTGVVGASERCGRTYSGALRWLRP